MGSIWGIKWEEGEGDFKDEWKDSYPIIKMADRLEEEERSY